jgi:hypothetical protein
LAHKYATNLDRSVCKLNPMVHGKNPGQEQAEMRSRGKGCDYSMLRYLPYFLEKLQHVS